MKRANYLKCLSQRGERTNEAKRTCKPQKTKPTDKAEPTERAKLTSKSKPTEETKETNINSERNKTVRTNEELTFFEAETRVEEFGCSYALADFCRRINALGMEWRVACKVDGLKKMNQTAPFYKAYSEWEPQGYTAVYSRQEQVARRFQEIMQEEMA